jgi:AcrR family transcriptional regulator
MQGLQQLTLGTLATAVGMSKSGLFAHFDSKEALQLATIEEALRIFDHEVLRDTDGEASGSSFACLERWLSFSERKVFPGGCLFLHQAVEFASRPGPCQ